MMDLITFFGIIGALLIILYAFRKIKETNDWDPEKYPYRWSCPDCYFVMSSNNEGVVVNVKLDHIEHFHS